MTLNPRTAAVKNTMQLLDLSFGSSKPRHYDNNRHPIITVVDRSGIHEIGVSWCRCHEAPKHNMQLMMAGLFPATFRNPKTAFTFWVLEDFHLDNLECKTTPSQFFSRLRRLTNDEFSNTVPVGGHDVSAEDWLTGSLRTNIRSFLESADSGELSFPRSDLDLDMRGMKNRSPDRWPYSALCVHSLESTSRRIGESTKIGKSLGISIHNSSDRSDIIVSVMSSSCEVL